MVQMGDPVAVERCISSLNNLTFFGKKMQLGYSKQAFLNDVQQPFELPDGSASFRDFMGNRNNRFTNPEAASKNRIAPPAKVSYRSLYISRMLIAIFDICRFCISSMHLIQ